MKLTYLGSTSTVGQCPTAYATDRGTYLIQGTKVDDPEAIAELNSHNNGIPLHEAVVEVPVALMQFIRDYEASSA